MHIRLGAQSAWGWYQGLRGSRSAERTETDVSGGHLPSQADGALYCGAPSRSQMRRGGQDVMRFAGVRAGRRQK